MERTVKDKVAPARLAVLVTGASGSMGAAAVKALAAEGKIVVMACRNLEKGEKVRQEVLSDVRKAQVALLRLDLSSRAGVDEFVLALESWMDEARIDGLSAVFNNAGVINRDYGLTPDGMERTMAVNFFNPALLTLRLLPFLYKGSRIVNMVSLTTRFASVSADWQKWGQREYSQLGTYGRSKLAFLLFSVELARRYPEFRVNVSDPGVVNSNMISMGRWFDPIADLLFRPFISSPEKGVAPALRALKACDSLGYYVGKGVRGISWRDLNNPLAAVLFGQVEDYL